MSTCNMIKPCYLSLTYTDSGTYCNVQVEANTYTYAILRHKFSLFSSFILSVHLTRKQQECCIKPLKNCQTREIMYTPVGFLIENINDCIIEFPNFKNHIYFNVQFQVLLKPSNKMIH